MRLEVAQHLEPDAGPARPVVWPLEDMPQGRQGTWDIPQGRPRLGVPREHLGPLGVLPERYRATQP
jgi:hypothetical protein